MSKIGPVEVAAGRGGKVKILASEPATMSSALLAIAVGASLNI